MKDLIEKILEHGGTIQLPYKENIEDWYESCGPRLALDLPDPLKYVVYFGCKFKRFGTLEDALKYFISYCDNVGALQQYVCNKYELDSEKDWPKVKKLAASEKRKRK